LGRCTRSFPPSSMPRRCSKTLWRPVRQSSSPPRAVELLHCSHGCAPRGACRTGSLYTLVRKSQGLEPRGDRPCWRWWRVWPPVRQAQGEAPLSSGPRHPRGPTALHQPRPASMPSSTTSRP
jgi:hypothetical protein